MSVLLLELGAKVLGSLSSSFRLTSPDLKGDEMVQLFGALIDGHGELINVGNYVKIDHQKVRY